MMTDPDPILIKAVRALATAQSRAKTAGTTLAPEDLDAFVHEETGGKYSLKDAQKVLGGVDTGVNLRNVGRSLAQGATMNFADEILGKLPSFLGGGAGAEEGMRLRDQMFKSAHPNVDMGAGIAGAIAPTLFAPEAEAATAGAAMLRGAKVGAIVGGLSGAGKGEDWKSRALGAGIDGVAGGILGGTIPALLSAVKYLRDPASRAMGRIAHAVEESGGVDAVKQTVADMTTAGRGKEMLLGDASDHLRRVADFAANNSDDALVPLAKAVKARQADASDRLLGDIRAHLPAGDADAGATRASLQQSLRQWADGPNGYGGLRDAGGAFDLSPVSKALTQPPVASALKQAKLAGDLTDDSPIAQMVARLAQMNPGVSPAAIKAGMTEGQFGADIQKLATAERPLAFDDVHGLKRALDGKAEVAWRSGNGALGEAYGTVRDAVNDALEQGTPGYKAVNAEYAQKKGLERALTSGEEAWNAVDSRALAREVSSLSAPELEQYRLGMASKLITQLRSASTNRDEATRLLNMSPAMEDKVKLIFGDEPTFKNFIKRVGAEAELAKMKGPISGSETARRLEARGFDPMELGLHAAAGGPAGLVHGIAQTGAKLMRGAVTRSTAREAGDALLTQGAPDIEAFLNRLQQRQPIVGRIGTQVLPTAGGRFASLLDF